MTMPKEIITIIFSHGSLPLSLQLRRVCKKFMLILDFLAPPVPNVILAEPRTVYHTDGLWPKPDGGQHAQITWTIPAQTDVDYFIVDKWVVEVDPIKRKVKKTTWLPREKAKEDYKKELFRRICANIRDDNFHNYDITDALIELARAQTIEVPPDTYFFSDFVTGTRRKQAYLRVTSVNKFGGNLSAQYPVDVGCFGGNTLIELSDGIVRKIEDIVVGDIVRSGDGSDAVVEALSKVPVFGMKKMCLPAPGISLTRGHPVQFKGTWFRAEELFRVREIPVEYVYNLVLSKSHNVVTVSKTSDSETRVICSTLGLTCPRLHALFPEHDEMYGSGFLKWFSANKDTISLECV